MMKIALLAPETSGKTCYLSSLYGELMDLINFKRDIAPLSFSLSSIDQERMFTENYSGLLRGRMPPGTKELHSIPVKIAHRINGSHTEIELIDFPGERLRSMGTPQDVEDTVSLLSQSDAFIILLDAGYAGSSGNIFRDSVASSKINSIIEKLRDRKMGSKFALHGMPLVFAVSKVDKLDNNPSSTLNAYNNIMTFFPECFSADADCVSCITQISLGANIDGADLSKKKGEYNPKNITLPFFLALGVGTLSGAKYQHKERDAIKENKERRYSVYQSEKNYTERAKNKLANRQSKSIFGKVEDFLFDGFETEMDLKARADKYQDDEDAAWSKFSRIAQELDEKIKEIDDLRIIGATALAQIAGVRFDGESPDAIMYWRGTQHRLKTSISCEVLTPLEAL